MNTMPYSQEQSKPAQTQPASYQPYGYWNSGYAPAGYEYPVQSYYSAPAYWYGE